MTRVGLRDVTNAIQQHPGAHGAQNVDRKVIKRETEPKRGPSTRRAPPAQPQAPSAPSSRAHSVERVEDFEGTEEGPITNPQEAREYRAHIYDYLRRSECNKAHRVSDPEFLDKQMEISSRMRGILLDWLVEVHYKFKLQPETLYLCINLIDRFLDKRRDIARKKLQLVGGTCMLIAAKYEEFRPPEVGDICYIMDNAYTREDILNMEVAVLNTLKFEVTVPSALQFLEYFIQDMGISRDADHFFLAQYLLEATLLEVKFLNHKPSMMAAASLYLANRIRKMTNPWSPALIKRTGYGEQESVKPLAKDIFEMIPGFRGKSLFKKYSMDKYRNVAPTIPSQ
mmetsp:Transcript_5021/g.12638  ORF Transcript_5021/g.12638 Transcript_5021/m.12638 type:complete len:340 (-) Transcript_5021:677-1696(-)|eukprot:CAMPEP_0179002664 /NCGR_PEP_ID=MMETSP0795-20121207/12186_1 /TAXON_ID=88552 /ORGANISM="Amoebophrya sp., Strain Ameob2" /LENGTH=339 /DNA_ID=CAMNT_0020696463 /DNA_START=1006 /DNA_END=2028 /DNA_ORIENTATION=+